MFTVNIISLYKYIHIYTYTYTNEKITLVSTGYHISVYYTADIGDDSIFYLMILKTN